MPYRRGPQDHKAARRTAILINCACILPAAPAGFLSALLGSRALDYFHDSNETLALASFAIGLGLPLPMLMWPMIGILLSQLRPRGAIVLSHWGAITATICYVVVIVVTLVLHQLIPST